MFIVTFYSYKGGVGRTMALANVATSSAKRGKRVLAVDFDLEAPTLPSYLCKHDDQIEVGLVDYVSEYRRTASAPSVADYILECSSAGPNIWMLPAGRSNDASYTDKLASIDWQSLYSEQMGYLFFEDTKQQWALFQGAGFDYVLIDSRTGHTDVGGICTRQLPDLVVAMFLPTRQNIAGLEPIVETIRRQSRRRSSEIALLFCASNVPDLDDEQEILARSLDEASVKLSFHKEEMQTVHHYDSLSILSHDIFCESRPNSRLAREYQVLATEIASFNANDAEGVKARLRKVLSDLSRPRRIQRVDARDAIVKQIEKISRIHDEDPEVLRLVAQVWHQLGDAENEVQALRRAIGRDPDNTQLRLLLARALQSSKKADEAAVQLRTVLLAPAVSAVEAATALGILETSAEGFSAEVDALLRRDNLPLEILSAIAVYAQRDRAETDLLAERLMTSYNQSDKGRGDLRFARNNLVLALIGARRFREAKEVIIEGGSLDGYDTADRFNQFIAEWGVKGDPDAGIVLENLATAMEHLDERDANFSQCMGLWHYAIADTTRAIELFERAVSQASGERAIFSCLTYLYRKPDVFRNETENAVEKLVRGEPLAPFFF